MASLEISYPQNITATLSAPLATGLSSSGAEDQSSNDSVSELVRRHCPVREK